MREKYRDLTRPVINEMKRCFFAIDLETTGSNPSTDDIIEVGIVRFDGCKPTVKLSFLVNTDRILSDHVIQMTGLTCEDLLYGIKQEYVYKAITDMMPGIRSHILCAHRADFDIGFLEKISCHVASPFRYVDTVEQAQKAMIDVKNFKLDTVADFFDIEIANRHRALDDAEACGRIMVELLNHFDRKFKFYEELDDDDF